LAADEKSLVIVESPGKIATISKVLGREFIVKASIGHVRDLPSKKKDDAKNSLVVGVGKDFSPVYVNLPAKKKVLDELKKAVTHTDRVYLCPDPDREGEAIAWHLKEALKLSDERTFRVTFDEITPRGIKAAFQQPRKINMDLVNAQQARRVLDRLVGYKLSPLLWKKLGRGLSAGRVQSVTVRLIVDREREIGAFNKEEYWTITATFQYANVSFEGGLRALDGKQVVSSADDLLKFKNLQISTSSIVRTLLGGEQETRSLADVLGRAAFVVRTYDVKEAQDRPYPPYATSQLQQAAANKLGYDARRTMRIAQELYQGVPLGAEGSTALITYMRTDSFRISQDALNDVRSVIGQRYGENFLPEKPNYYASRKGGQDAHECIRPTHPEIVPDDVRQYLSDEQYKLYRLIWQRFVACQMRPALFDAATCDIGTEGEGTRNAVFRATGRVLKFEGWLAVYGDHSGAASHIEAKAEDRTLGDETTDSDEEPAKAKKKNTPQVLPAMQPGDRPEGNGVEPVQHFTQPPPRYTEASLVKTLEREGIGRPSTYASIISTIQDRGYVHKQGVGGRGVFASTPLGCAVNDRLVNFFDHSIMDLGFTRLMEEELDKIEESHLDWKHVLNEFYELFTKDLAKAADGMASAKDEAVKTEVKCPECGECMEKRFNRFGYYLRCPKEGCKGTLRSDAEGNVQAKPKPVATGLKCDRCGKDVVKAVGRFGAYLHCVDYPEKKCGFTMKLTKDGRPARKFEPFPTGLKCEKCKKNDLVIRVSARGKKKIPKPFLSCSGFPKCRFAKDITDDLKGVGEQAAVRWHENDGKNRRDLEVYLKAMIATQAAADAQADADVEVP
jgi:DNA topoisomerase-1